MRSVPEWIGKTDDAKVPPRVRIKRKPRGDPLSVSYFFDRSIPEPNSGCWIWLMAIYPNGYGAVNRGGKTRNAHRICFETVHEVILPRSVDVCHRCDNRLCVNPDHLFAGSRADNMLDCSSKGRAVIPNLRGEDCPAAVLTESEVLAIRASGRPHRALAREYGVDRGTIKHIVRRSTWRHI